MNQAKRVLEALWRAAPAAERRFEEASLAGLPEAAQRYLRAAIAPEALLAEAVRLRMHGEIRLKGWCPFRAEQVIRRDGGMIWWAKVRMAGLPVSGYDSLIDGAGRLDWRILGLLPVMRRSGPDITRSAIGRVLGERIWLPSALAPPYATWQDAGDGSVTASVGAFGETIPVTLWIDSDGMPTDLSFPRWGETQGNGFGWGRFGGRVEAMAQYGDFRIPARVQVGWLGDGSHLDENGAFFRCQIDHAAFR